MKRLFLSIMLFVPAWVFAQNFWYDIPESKIPPIGERRIVPRLYRTVKIDLNALQPLLAAAPRRFTPAAVGNTLTIELPTPDGHMSRFLLTESPVMMPELQAKHPNIRCYTGTGIDEPGALLKCDLTLHGFHAQVLRGKGGDWFIDPYSFGDREHYTVYFKKDYPKPAGKTWICEAEEEIKKEIKNNPIPDQGDCKLREYVLALACTGEYADYHGGTVPAAESAMNTTMNRVNGVFEMDMAITMFLVNNNDTLIFLDGNTDPYSNNNGGAMLNQNQTTCNNRIGNANYDIGHVFSTGGGGVAVLACVCSSGNKAKGVTGGSDPVGDAFDIDYVAHEMGHQFGCNHTFNGTHGSCNGNRSLPSAYEPGSGSTIMAYAGICDDQDVQPHSDAYFHAKSLLDAGAFVTGGGHTCDNEVITGNNAPTANAGADYTIPKSTPFVLTATGSDADGDPITYCWEQYNNGDSTQPPDGTDLDGPNFRSLIPTSEPKRYFPALGEVINNNNPTWEVLSSVGRTMNFRVTVRDNYGGAGCTKEDNMVLTVAGGAGPFEVTAPNTPVSWVGNTTRPVTWDVAGTAGAPVSSANVKISLSIDGGWTYPTVILASTPNDGIELITVPNTPSNNCRIKVEGVGNVFYDISDVDFIISAGLPVELLEFSARLQGKNGALLSWATASEKDNRGFEIQQATKNETKGLSFEPVGFVEGKGNSALRNDYGFELNELLPGEYYFRLRQIDFDGSESYSPVRSLLIKSDFLLMTRPNPVQNELEVQVFQETDAALHISIINQWGQEQELLSRQEVNKGETLWRFNLSNLPAGVYVLLVKRNQGMEERKLVIGYR